MSDDLREIIEKATQEAEDNAASTAENTTASTTSDTPSTAENTEPEAKVADDTAKTATDGVKTDETAKTTTTTEKGAEIPKTDGEKEPLDQRHRVDRPPQSWKTDAKAAWGELPLNVRQEVYRREQQVNQTLQESAQARQVSQQYAEACAPYMARINAHGVTGPQAMSHLLEVDYGLSTGSNVSRAQLMAKLINDYDIDIGALDDALTALKSGQQQPQQPDIEQMVQQRVQQAMTPFLQERQENERAVQQAAIDEVEAMMYDPKYPHFEDVRQDMADIIELSQRRGVEISLADAYTKAVLMNPQLSAQANRQANHDAAQRAKAAAVSVSNQPGSAASTNLSTGTDLRSTLTAAFDALGN